MGEEASIVDYWRSNDNSREGRGMFQPERLYYLGQNQGIDVFNYEGVRIDAIIRPERDGSYLYVGLDRRVPQQVLNGMLSWFGIDLRRQFEECKFMDESRFFVQRKAA